MDEAGETMVLSLQAGPYLRLAGTGIVLRLNLSTGYYHNLLDRVGGDAEDDDEETLRIRCGAGTYIRSLARDIAQAAGTVGVSTDEAGKATAGILDLPDPDFLSRLQGRFGHRLGRLANPAPRR